jgi:hypothetical protein
MLAFILTIFYFSVCSVPAYLYEPEQQNEMNDADMDELNEYGHNGMIEMLQQLHAH